MRRNEQAEGHRREPERYAAFISYAHADTPFATRLQRQLETYRLPGRLANARMADGAAPDRIGAVFRDVADMAAATSLTEAIRSALAQSSALIVICSVDARQSRWVEAEIALFRELHPNAPILAAIAPTVDGAENPHGVMPPALTMGGGEPLAADMRKGGDGARLGLLKIVAALAGVPLDALIQRDAARKLRRVIVVTLIAGAGLIAMLAMTILAIQSRNEANRQRAEAEGLVEYMLTDLRDELIGVGRIDVRTGVYDRAMAYYAAQGPVADLPEDSLERRARVLLAMGQDEARGGRVDEAARRYDEAYRTTAALLARAPNHPDRIFDHAQSVFYVGDIARQRGDMNRARGWWMLYLDLAIQLQRVDDDPVRALRERAYAEGNLCTLDGIDQSTALRAVPRCRTALSAMQRVLAMRPDDVEAIESIGNRHAWLGEALERFGRREEALGHQQQATRMARTLLGHDGDNYDRIELLTGRLVVLAEMQEQRGNTDDARVTLQEARTLIVRLLLRDGNNQHWREMDRRARRMQLGDQ